MEMPDLPNPEACVICLDRISEKAIAQPCKHDQFDFGCLATWLNQQLNCPLCKAEVKSVKYDLGNAEAGTIFELLPQHENEHPSPSRTRRGYRQGHDRAHGHRERDLRAHRIVSGSRRHDRRRDQPRSLPQSEDALSFRRRVYQDSLLSARVGTNRISRYQNLTPASFTNSNHLVLRAKTWIRRELSVFDFLNPNSTSYGNVDRRASNAEFLLDYIIAILKSIDIKGSSGQAEELLKDFLGRSHARIFLHELESWLRSPYEKLEDWDRNVQYGDVGQSGTKIESR